jgi:ferric-dicitrate binding protein FerR (iron transport regulator)
MEITPELLRRYVRDACTPAEALAVAHWLADPAHAEQARFWLQPDWDAPPRAPDLPNERLETLLGQLHERLDERPVRPLRRRWWAASVRIAAAVAAVVVGTLAWKNRAAEVPFRTERTAYGQTRTVALPDGSTVTLNGHSSVRYAATWAAEVPREVWLEGEAYFRVRHRANDQKFQVHTDLPFVVEVLGTEFTVSERSKQTRVVLNSGKIRLDFDQQRQPDVVLKPGELVEFRGTTERFVRRTVNPERYSSWKDRRLLFDETPLTEVAEILRETHGLRVVFADETLADRRVTGTLPAENLDLLRTALEQSFGLRIAQRPGEWNLHPTHSSL